VRVRYPIRTINLVPFSLYLLTVVGRAAGEHSDSHSSLSGPTDSNDAFLYVASVAGVNWQLNLAPVWPRKSQGFDTVELSAGSGGSSSCGSELSAALPSLNRTIVRFAAEVQERVMPVSFV
jgi:hypothetical protein